MTGRKKEKIPLLQSMEDILNRAREISGTGEPYRVAVAAAHDDAVVEALVHSHDEGIAESVLFGDAPRINEMIEKFGGRPSDYEVVNTESNDEAAVGTAAAAGRGYANVVLKGLLSTSTLLKNILSKEYGLRRRGLLSHTAVLSPNRYPKLLCVTDGGMVIKPNFDQKVEIIRNAVLVGRSLGIDKPRVAVITPIDHIVKDFPETFEAAALSKMAMRGQIKNCIVDGPMSFDTAIYPFAVEYAGIVSQVAGQTDIVLADSIEEGNILAKSLVQFGEANFAGVIVGANVPIALVSRADHAYNKLTSIALAVVVAHFIKTR